MTEGEQLVVAQILCVEGLHVLVYKRQDLFFEGGVRACFSDFVGHGTAFEVFQLGFGPEHRGVEFGGQDVEVGRPLGILGLLVFEEHGEDEREPWVLQFGGDGGWDRGSFGCEDC